MRKEQIAIRRSSGPLAICLLLTLPGVVLAGNPVGISVSPEPHAPILVLGDPGFELPTSGVRSGSGTASDPYVISDYLITAPAGFGIRLQDTGAHVRIERVVVPAVEGEPVGTTTCIVATPSCAGSIGIDLVNASNVTIRDVRVLWARDGIRIASSTDVVVKRFDIGSDVTEEREVDNGIRVLNSAHVNLTKLYMHNTNDILDVRFSENVTIHDSTFIGEAEFDYFRIQDVTDLTIVKNHFVNISTTYRSILRGVTMGNNLYEGGEGALRRIDTPARVMDVTVCGNTMRDLAGYALEFGGFDHATIGKNRIDGGVDGMYLIAGTTLTLTGNAFTNQTGVSLAAQSRAMDVNSNNFVSGTVILRSDDGDVRRNWWGDASGPSLDGPGTGTGVLARDVIDFSSWLTAPVKLESCGTHGEVDDPVPTAISAEGTVSLSHTVSEEVSVAGVSISATAEVHVDESVSSGEVLVLLP